MKAKRIFLSALLVLTFSFTGCSVKILDRTPAIATASPTGSYTLSAQALVKKKTVDLSTLQAFVVIDSEQYPMTADQAESGSFKFDYQPPVDELNTRFYYILNYYTQKQDAPRIPGQIISDLYQIQFPNSISLSLNKKRAAIGSRITVLGQGFSSEDIIFVDTVAAKTSFISPTELQFIVPESTPKHGYVVEVRSLKRAQIAGYLRIDAANPLSVLPNSLDLQSGQRQALAFALDTPAPIGGLYLNITTDIPDSIIMPEVLIPEGARTVSASIEGDKVGNGNLFINANGLVELVVPVTIR
ncbi:MAG TPA: hypothetical protein DD423_01640 [Opitutae bacterium]|nr:hypothetical protein [Opitutae bacterium]